MGRKRRNAISYEEERIILGVAALSAVVAAFAPGEPTGSPVVDAILKMALAAFVTWAGAAAPWWALLGGAGLVTASAIAGPLIVLGLGLAALAGAAWIGSERANEPVIRSVVAGLVVQVATRLEWNPVFLWSGFVAAIAIGTIAVTGVIRRRRHVRKRVYIGAGVLAGIAAIAVVGLAAAVSGARSPASAGYAGILEGLDFVQQGETAEAAEALRTAAEELDDASDALGGPLTQLARAVPGLAQNRDAAAELMERAAESAASAAATLDVVVLDRLTIQDGVVDVAGLAILAPPLDELLATIEELDDSLRDADTPWLVAPFKTRLDDTIERANQVLPQARATAAAARIAPAMLGAEGPRRYFVAFVNNAEARGQSGLMGNWSEVTITDGRFEVTAEGRTARLQSDALRELELDVSDDYMARYAAFGANVGGGVDPKYWSNVTIPPDMPSVGNVMAQMYETATGRDVDGVFVIDPAGIAALLEVTGSVRLDDIGVTLNSANVERFLVVEQYEFAENEREDLLAAVTEQTIDNVVDGSLPAPQRMLPALADAVVQGHISAWAVDPDEERLLELIGMDGALPEITAPATDAFAVSNDNASGNKIESFLERTIRYRAEVDEESGDVNAQLRISLTNDAPTSGYPEYVIGNLIDEPTGTNRMLVEVHTMLTVDEARIDGTPAGVVTLPELGYQAWRTMLTVPAGETVDVELDLSGSLGAGEYRLVYRPQPLPNEDRVVLEAVTTGGAGIFSVDDRLERRSVVSADGVEAWR